MSDTSDYTIADPGPEKDSASTSSRTVTDQAADEIEDVMQVIRDSLKAMYEASKALVPRPKYSENYARRCGLRGARELIPVLTSFGDAVAVLPEENCAETADLLVEIVAEAASTLAAFSDKNKTSDAYATETVTVTKALIYKCQAQVIQRTNQSLSYSDQTAAVLREPELEDALDIAISFIGYEYPDIASNSANILHTLLSKYVHSLTAIYGTASGLSSVYVEYAESVLSEMDSGYKNAAYRRIRTWWLSFWR